MLGSPGVFDGRKLRFSELTSCAFTAVSGVHRAFPLAADSTLLALVFIFFYYDFTASFKVLIFILVIRGSRISRGRDANIPFDQAAGLGVSVATVTLVD